MRRVAGWFVVAWLVFALSMVLEAFLRTGPAWLPQAALKTALIVFSVAAIRLDRRRSFAEYGFRRPNSMRWLRAVGIGMLLGMLATAAVVFSPAAGLKHLFGGYGLLQVIVWLWFYSSLSEEIFTRGWFQTLAAAGEPSGRARRPVIASGVLFGSMHLSLLLRDSDGWTVLIIVAATTCLGLYAAHLRATSGSIWPSIVAHVSFNVGGAAAAILLTIASLATGGMIPRP